MTDLAIRDHRLVGAPFMQSPNTSGSLVDPWLLVMHYTASGGTGRDDAKFFQSPAAKASAHFVVDRDGTITQCVALNKRAWHAGVSVWRGKKNCNDFSIGIEIDNYGVLQKRADGHYYSWTGQKIPDHEVISANHPVTGGHGYWQTYPEKQIEAVLRLTEALLEAYPSLREIVGHEDIAPRRKTDPGPAFPMARFKTMPGGRDDRPVLMRTVQTASLNVRAGAGTTYEILSKVEKGEQVEVIYDAGEWAQIKTKDGVKGWVFDQYLL